MNYEKKRKRQAGRQKGTSSERRHNRMMAMHDRMFKAVQILIDRGVFPPVNFEPIPVNKDVNYVPPKLNILKAPLTPLCKKCDVGCVEEFFEITPDFCETVEYCDNCKDDRMSNEAIEGLSKESSAGMLGGAEEK